MFNRSFINLVTRTGLSGRAKRPPQQPRNTLLTHPPELFQDIAGTLYNRVAAKQTPGDACRGSKPTSKHTRSGHCQSCDDRFLRVVRCPPFYKKHTNAHETLCTVVTSSLKPEHTPRLFKRHHATPASQRSLINNFALQTCTACMTRRACRSFFH